MAFDVAELHLPITPKRAPAKPRRRNVLNTEYRYIIDDRVDNTIDYGIVTTATHYKMALKYVSSYLLAVAAGNENPSVDDLKKILDAVGSDVDEECLQGLVDSMSGKTVHETIAAGMTKLQSMPAGGAVMPAAAAGGAPAAAEDKAEAKKPEAEPEEEEDDMGFSLFD